MLDIIVLAVIGMLTIIGFLNGAVRQLFGLAGVVAGYVLATRYYHFCSKFLTSFHPSIARAISFVAIFLACIVVAHIIGWVVGRLVKYFRIGISEQNRWWAPGVFEGLHHHCRCGNGIHHLFPC